MTEPVEIPANLHFLSGGGRTGALMRAHDWSASPLGSPDLWPSALRTAVSLMLGSVQPVYIAWGPDLISLYNDGYLPIVGDKHPAIGQPYATLWAEIWPSFQPIVAATLAGKSQHFIDLQIALSGRPGVPTGYFTFSYTALREDSGAPGGFYCGAVETTERVLAERRQRFRLELTERLMGVNGPSAAMDVAVEALGQYLGASRVGYCEVQDNGEQIDFRACYVDGVAPITGTYNIDDFGPERIKRQRRGETEVINDVRTDGGGSEELYDAIETRSLVSVALIRDGAFRASLYINYRTPHDWTSDEVSLIEEVAARTWSVVERARAEAALRESEARFRLMVDTVPQIIWIADANGQMEFFNRQFSLYTGAPFTSMSPAEVAAGFMHPDDGAAVVSAFETVLVTGEPFHIEHRIRSSAGDYRWFHVRADPYRDPATGKIIRWFGVSVDIHDRRLAEEALREINVDLERKVTERALGRGKTWQLSSDIMCVANEQGYLEQSNPAWMATLGYTEAEVAKTAVFDLIHPDDMASTQSAFEDVFVRGLTLLGFTNRYRAKDGRYRWLSWVAVPEDGKAYCSARDITEDKAQAADLLLHKNIVQSHRSPVVAFDREYRLTAFNEAHSEAFLKVFGHRAAVGDDLLELFPHEQKAMLRNAMDRALAGESFTMVEEYGDATVAKAFFEVSYFPLRDEAGQIIGAFHHANDITARRRTEAELQDAQEALRHSQKMDAMGQLTGGVAHDFNNLLTPIIGSLDMLLRKGLGSERDQRLIAGAAEAAERARLLVQRLLAFARRQPLQPIAVDMARLVSGMKDLIATTTGPQIKVIMDVSEHLPRAMADSNQVEMALLNLSVNARDAMPHGGTLRITVRAETVEIDNSLKLRPGAYICFSVEDTGMGMDEATRERAIEPFFSTKGVGKGTGLGLSMVHGLASQLGGALDIQSQLGVGTNVELWLPQSAAVASDAKEVNSVAFGSPLGSKTALLVDDEELVRVSTAEMLKDLGFTVIEAQSAEAAMGLIAEGTHFDVLITDHLMPRMSGTELAREVRTARSGVPVLLISGYTDAVDPGLPRLTKPFKTDDLAISLARLVT